MTLPHNRKMQKNIIFFRCRNFVKRFNFVSTPWKIIITHHHPHHHHPPTPLSSTLPPPTHLPIYIDLMKCLRYEHQSNFPLWGGSELILGIGRENKIFFLRTPAAVKFFHQIVRKMIFWCKKKSLPTQMDLYNTYMVSYTIP